MRLELRTKVLMQQCGSHDEVGLREGRMSGERFTTR